MTKPIRLAVTALGGRIVAGHPNAKGTAITEGSRQDVTSDFMKALIDKADHHGGKFDIEGGGDHWDVVVTKRVATASGVHCTAHVDYDPPERQP